MKNNNIRKKQCHRCHGKGKVHESFFLAIPPIDMGSDKRCEYCAGRGYLICGKLTNGNWISDYDGKYIDLKTKNQCNE